MNPCTARIGAGTRTRRRAGAREIVQRAALLVVSAPLVSACFQKLDSDAAEGGGASVAAPGTSHTVALDTPPIELDDGSSTADPCIATTASAMAVLGHYCAPCHGGSSPGARQGQPPFDFVLDVGRLESAVSATVKDPITHEPVRFLVPGDPDHSRIYLRAYKGEMPPPDLVGLPPTPRPTVSDLSVLRAWIASCLGAPPAEPGDGGGPGLGGAAPEAGSAGTAGDGGAAGIDGGDASTGGTPDVGGAAGAHGAVSGGGGTDGPPFGGNGGTAGTSEETGGTG